jgi:hypothetical protein
LARKFLSEPTHSRYQVARRQLENGHNDQPLNEPYPDDEKADAEARDEEQDERTAKDQCP